MIAVPLRRFWLVRQYDIGIGVMRVHWVESIECPKLPGAEVGPFPVDVMPGKSPGDVLREIEISEWKHD